MKFYENKYRPFLESDKKPMPSKHLLSRIIYVGETVYYDGIPCLVTEGANPKAEYMYPPMIPHNVTIRALKMNDKLPGTDYMGQALVVKSYDAKLMPVNMRVQ